MRCDRPAGDDPDARDPALLGPVSGEEAVLVPEPLGDHLRLGPLGRRPGLHEADHIGGSRRQDLLDAGLALLPGPVAPPDVPGDDSHRGLDNGAVGLVLVEAHPDSLAAWRLVRPGLATGSPPLSR